MSDVEAPLSPRELHALKLLAALWTERDVMLANLTSTQARCTELLEENRKLRAEVQNWRDEKDHDRQGEEF